MTPADVSHTATPSPQLGEARDLIQHLEQAVALRRAHQVRRLLCQPVRTLVYAAALRGRRSLPWSFPVQARTFFGKSLRVVLPEESACQLWYFGFIEEDVTWFLLSRLRAGMTFIDAGAHVGYFSLLASQLVGPYGRVHAFEPAQRTFTILRKNTHQQANITVQQTALWSHRTTLPFHDFGDHYATLNSLRHHRLARESAVSLQRSYEVHCISLDEYCEANMVVPDFIKIDTEISEPQILQGSKRIISRYQPIISLEVWDDESRSSREDILFLLAQGYTAYEYDAGRLIPHRLHDHYEYTNVFFLPCRDVTSERRFEVSGRGERPGCSSSAACLPEVLPPVST